MWSVRLGTSQSSPCAHVMNQDILKEVFCFVCLKIFFSYKFTSKKNSVSLSWSVSWWMFGGLLTMAGQRGWDCVNRAVWWRCAGSDCLFSELWHSPSFHLQPILHSSKLLYQRKNLVIFLWFKKSSVILSFLKLFMQSLNLFSKALSVEFNQTD